MPSRKSGVPSGKPKICTKQAMIPTSQTCTFWTSSRIPPAPGCRWGMPATTCPPASTAATSACAATTCCTPWAGTPLVCPPKITPSSTTSTPATAPGCSPIPTAGKCSWWNAPTTGRERSTPLFPIITAGRNGFSCCCTAGGWPTGRWAANGGAPLARPSWPTSRWSRANAGAATAR